MITIQQKNFYFFNTLATILFLYSIFTIGCAPTKEHQRGSEETTSLEEFITQYEKTFDPREYDPGKNIQHIETEKDTALENKTIIYTPAPPETIPGFRVQVLLTLDIDSAIAVRDLLLSLLPNEWTYIVYDSPYYKIRVGNFLDRPSANKMVRLLNEKGFTNSWVVPDNVLKNLPPRPRPTPPEEEKFQE